MRYGRIWSHGGAVLLLAASAGCGDEQATGLPEKTAEWQTPASQAERPVEQNRPPQIEAVRLEPEDPASGDLLRTAVVVNDPDGDTVTLGYAWSLDGRPLAMGSSEVQLGEVDRGARIEVVVTASDGHAEGDPARGSVVVRNRRPVLTGLELDPPADVPSGRPVVATPEARDPDGDPVEYRYLWTVNGRDVSRDAPQLDTAGLGKGDRIQVQVWARDDRDESDPVYSQVVRVANAAPEIVSTPPGLAADGAFRYPVEAKDADGGPLRFELNRGPKAMRIDPVLGVVSWTPGPSDAGVHPVEIEVRDREGASTVQTFEITIEVEEAPAPVPAAVP